MSTPTERWQAMLGLMNGSFDFYMQAQEAMGYNREQALERLRRAWELEDRERLQAIAQLARLTQRAAG